MYMLMLMHLYMYIWTRVCEHSTCPYRCGCAGAPTHTGARTERLHTQVRAHAGLRSIAARTDGYDDEWAYPRSSAWMRRFAATNTYKRKHMYSCIDIHILVCTYMIIEQHGCIMLWKHTRLKVWVYTWKYACALVWNYLFVLLLLLNPCVSLWLGLYVFPIGIASTSKAADTTQQLLVLACVIYREVEEHAMSCVVIRGYL